MTVEGGNGYNGLLVATNDQGLVDYSFIAKTQTPKISTIVQTNNTDGKINLSLLPTSTTGANNKIPITTSNNVLNNSWLDYTTTTASANKVVVTGTDKLISNNLLNSTDGSTSTVANNKDKIVKTGSTGQINYNLIKTTNVGGSTNANTIVKLDSNGLLATSMFRTDQFLPLTGGMTTGNILVNGTSPHANNKTSGGTFTGLTNLKATLPNFTGFGSNSYTDGFLIGMNGSADGSNYLMIATHDNGNEPIYVRQYAGSTGYSGLKKNDGTENISHEITLMDANGNTKVTKLKITSTEDAQGTSNTEAPLEIGDHESLHLEIDNNEIMAKATKDTVSTLNLNSNGGLVSIGAGGMSTSGPLKGANTTITGTLGVSGATSLSNTLSVTGTTAMTGKLTANGGIDTKAINNTTLTASGNVSSGGNLSVTGTSTLTGKVTAQGGIDVTGGNITLTANSTATSGIVNYVTGTMASNDHWRIAGGATATDSGFLEIATDDNGSEPIYVRQYNGGGFASKTRELILLDASGNTTIPGNLTTTNGTITAKLGIFTSTADARGSSYASPAVTIGPSTGVHLELDQNEIQGKASATTVGNISLNADGGNVLIADNSGATGSLSVPHGNISTGGTLTADGNTTLKGTLVVTGTITAPNYSGNWGGVVNQITTHDTAPDLTRWMLTYVDGYVRYITMSEMADKMKSTITSGIDLSSRLPMPSLTTSAIGYIFTGYGRYHTLPSGGTWFWWACCFNANSTSIGPKWGISSGGSEIDLEYDNRRAHFFAMRIKST